MIWFLAPFIVAIIFFSAGLYLLVHTVLLQQQRILKQGDLLIMTVQQVKDRIAAARTAIQATVVTEIAEVKLLVTAGGATPTQLDEIGQDVVDLEAATLTAVASISDNVAGEPGPDPDPNPQP